MGARRSVLADGLNSPAKDAGDFFSSLRSQAGSAPVPLHSVFVAKPEDDFFYAGWANCEILRLIVCVLELSIPALVKGQ